MELFAPIFEFLRTMWTGVVEILNRPREVITDQPLVLVAAIGAAVALAGVVVIITHRNRHNR